MDRVLDGQLVITSGAHGTLPTGLAGTVTAVVPRLGISVRAGTLADVPFIDRVQKAHSRELGFLPTMAIEGKIKLGQVLIAEMKANVDCGLSNVEEAGVPSLRPSTLDIPQSPSPVGYLIAADRYQKRDEVGYVTQIGVLPEYRRSLVAAALLQAQFDRSAYGCRLYCCWCAQDLKANEFWEAMGFTPIAFRTGSRTKGKDVKNKAAPRMHIFWQKRVREGDTTTPWWYPSVTGGGELREDRLVFPIPPGVGWRDVLPVVLPEAAGGEAASEDSGATVCGTPQALPSDQDTALSARPGHPEDKTTRRSRKKAEIPTAPPAEDDFITVTQAEYDAAREAIRERMRTNPPAVPVRPLGLRPNQLWFVPDYNDYRPNDFEIEAEIRATRAAAEAAAAAKARQTAKDAKKADVKIDPRLTAMARELRDRWSEQCGAIVALPGKYDVRRSIVDATATDRALPMTNATALLPAA